MSAHSFPLNLDRCLREGFFNSKDPGSAGTIDVSLKGKAICSVTTAGAESRVLPAAGGLGIGTELLVYLNHQAGALTITGADTGSVVLSSDGDHAEFVVVGDDQVKQWNARGISVANSVTAAVAFGTDNVLVRSDGTGRGTQLSGVVLNDADQFTSKLGFLTGAGAAASASGVVMGGGTSANPLLTAVADTNFIEFRAKSTGTGSQRLGYFRYDAAGSGTYECVRGLTVLTAAAANARGGSFSLVASSTGYITGEGIACHARLEVTDTAVPANGTYYGALVDLFGDGSSSSLAATTKYAILGVAAAGNATFITSVKNAIAFDGAASASGGDMISPGTSMGTVTGTVRILINGVVAFLPYYSHEGHA